MSESSDERADDDDEDEDGNDEYDDDEVLEVESLCRISLRLRDVLDKPVLAKDLPSMKDEEEVDRCFDEVEDDNEAEDDDDDDDEDDEWIDDC
jgi:hypothetical protein